jgi:hypothetical protein
MIENLPNFVNIIFVITTLLTILFLYKASNWNNATLLLIAAWVLIQGIVASTRFYTNTTIIPPRFLLLVLPPLLVIVLLFLTPKGIVYIDSLNTKALTHLHVVRILVELVLFSLFVHHQLPRLMTFEGRNFDILSGITAPIISYAFYTVKKIDKSILLLWNFICLGLLLNIVVNAVLSLPFPFQQFAFGQPNVAVLYFPFIWLPCCIVPIVLFAHLAAIRHILKGKIKG